MVDYALSVWRFATNKRLAKCSTHHYIPHLLTQLLFFPYLLPALCHLLPLCPPSPLSTQQAEEAAIAAVLGDDEEGASSTEADEALAEAAKLVAAYSNKLTEAIDLAALQGEDGE